MSRRGKVFGAAALLVVCLDRSAGLLAAQAQQGPITPPPKREVIRIPAEAPAEPPPVPVEEIIRRYAQKEDEFQRAFGAYSYRKIVRVQELGEDGKPAGEFQLTTELAIASDGKRYERILQRPASTLHRMTLAAEDLEILARIPLFPLATAQLDKYELTYAGKQLVDELTSYIFRVRPRQRERTRAYFEGLVWVDDRDLLIVKTYGKWVTETGDVASAELPFSFFETYREPIDGKHWFPTYARSDDMLKLKSGEVRIRLTIRWTEYKPVGTGIPKSAPATTGTKSATPQQPRPPQSAPNPQ